LFPADTAPGEVGELLKLYNEVRYDHTVIMCISSRVGYDRRQEVAKDVERFVPNATWSDSPWYDAWTNYPVKQAEHLLAIRREKVV
jgi:salicylate hydroxylase